MRTTETADHTEQAGATPARPRIPRWAVILAPLALVAILFFVIGRLGFQPTDEGNIAAQSVRILHGQVPHRDIIFARPMGSAFLHMVDLALPMPLFEASRLIGLGEFVLYSLLFAWLIFDLAPARWGVVRWLAALVSSLINIHTFLLSGWYTTDGLLFLALGCVILRSGLRDDRRGLVWLGLLFLGAAPLMKQSFAAAPVIGLVWVIADGRRHRREGRLRSTLEAGIVLSLPVAVYISSLLVLGAGRPFFHQILGARSVYGADFVTAFRKPGPRGELLLFVAVLVALLAVGRAGRSILREGGIGRLLDLGSRIGVTVLVLRLVFIHHFEFRGTWASALAWGTVAVFVWGLIVERRFGGAGAVIAMAAWMASLSWGYAVPDLVGGSLALFLLDQTWRGVSVEARGRLQPAVVVSVLVFALGASALIGARFIDARFDHPYGDLDKAHLTASLVAASPEWGRIRTNPTTAAYLTQLARCVRSHPARWTAVLPDNPAVYPALHLNNPFPIDWMYPLEVAGEEGRIVQAARGLQRSGDYTVLFQTFPIARLTQPGPPPKLAGRGAQPLPRPLLKRIWRTLDGNRFTCGYFVGVSAPPRHV